MLRGIWIFIIIVIFICYSVKTDQEILGHTGVFHYMADCMKACEHGSCFNSSQLDADYVTKFSCRCHPGYHFTHGRCQVHCGFSCLRASNYTSSIWNPNWNLSPQAFIVSMMCTGLVLVTVVAVILKKRTSRGRGGRGDRRQPRKSLLNAELLGGNDYDIINKRGEQGLLKTKSTQSRIHIGNKSHEELSKRASFVSIGSGEETNLEIEDV